MYFHPKMTCPPATYDVISRNHSNWPPLNLSQNLCEGWTNSYWKRWVLIFLSSRKKLRKTSAGVASTTSPPPPPYTLYVRGLRYLQNHKGGNLFFPSFSTYLAIKFQVKKCDLEILNIRVTRTYSPKSASNNTSFFVKHFSRILTHSRLFIINAGRWPLNGYRSIS